MTYVMIDAACGRTYVGKIARMMISFVAKGKNSAVVVTHRAKMEKKKKPSWTTGPVRFRRRLCVK